MELGRANEPFPAPGAAGAILRKGGSSSSVPLEARRGRPAPWRAERLLDFFTEAHSRAANRLNKTNATPESNRPSVGLPHRTGLEAHGRSASKRLHKAARGALPGPSPHCAPCAWPRSFALSTSLDVSDGFGAFSTPPLPPSRRRGVPLTRKRRAPRRRAVSRRRPQPEPDLRERRDANGQSPRCPREAGDRQSTVTRWRCGSCEGGARAGCEGRCSASHT